MYDQLVHSCNYYYYICTSKLREFNPFNIDEHLEKANKEFNIIHRKLENGFLIIDTLTKQYVQKLQEVKRAKNLLYTIGNTIPDMMWAKNKKGEYIYVNKTFRDEFFYGLSEVDIITKTDLDLSRFCKNLVGEDNHTFGEDCANSDLLTINSLAKERFLEEGYINGKYMYLEVYKNVLVEDGEVIGTVGIGRDVTEYYSNLKSAITNMNSVGTPRKSVIELEKLLDQYKFSKKV